MRRFLLAMLCLAALLVASVGTVAAGELTGNGKDLKPLRANSECAFSGLDDDDDDGFGRTQSWGQIPKADRDFLRGIGVSPNALCNGHLNPLKGH